MTELLGVKHLVCEYRVADLFGRKARIVRAVDGVSFGIQKSEVFGLVGETGCGKTSLAKALALINRPTSGSISFLGETIDAAETPSRRWSGSKLQYVYQDPGASLDPRWTLRASLHEPLVVHSGLSKAARESKVVAICNSLGLKKEMIDRFPRQVSGGQLRRVGLARVLTIAPVLLILDEPTAGLDSLTRGRVVSLLQVLQKEFGLTYLLITHDLAVAGALCDRIAVMKDGRIVELGRKDDIVSRPQHPYTQSLMLAHTQLSD